MKYRKYNRDIIMSNLKYFKGSFIVTVIGICLGAYVGYYYTHSFEGALSSAFIVLVLGILEISLSFDNAVVNATVLRDMNHFWRTMFITWGILIAVFGMRLVFPFLLVGITAGLGPVNAVSLALNQPAEYSRILTNAQPVISSFGGSFLAMVGLKFFIDAEKDSHWIKPLEKFLKNMGRVEAVEIGLVLIVLYFVSGRLQDTDQLRFMVGGIMGLVAYLIVDGIGSIMGSTEESMMGKKVKSGFALFLYLETLDASFSFDGVIGAFALSNNVFIIAIGLGVGAMFVRSLTIMLVEKGTLAQYKYLEHGAFYAIIVLAGIMFLNAFMHIPEVVSGCLGAGIIGISFISSIMYNRKHSAEKA
jgi:uncharacterized protein